MKEAIKKGLPECEVKGIPVADGGEGTVDCFLLATAAEKKEVETTGPYGEPVTAYYALDRANGRAILEMAQVAGLPQVEDNPNPRKTTTFGLGKLIEDALETGCREIVIGLGGSCTNDGGMGMARALGVQFFDENGQVFAPDADEMTRISHIDSSKAAEKLQGVHIIAMCDITNPMYGPKGAAYVFGPQKGADPETVKELDDNLCALATVIESDLGVSVADFPGAGAAGALGAGIVAFLGGELKSGIETVLDIVEFDRELDGAQLVFTGEGQVDSQSVDGKVISGIAKRAVKKNVPCIVVAGSVAPGAEAAYDTGVCSLFSINRMAMDFSESRAYSDRNLADTMEAIVRLAKAVSPG